MSVTEVGGCQSLPQGFAAEKGSGGQEELSVIFSRLVQEQREEFYEKLRTGTTEPSYQIGAGSYTQKQWERLLKGFDSAEDALRRAAGLKKRKRPPETAWKKPKTEEDKNAADKDAGMLLTEFTACTYPASESEEEDPCYFTFYSPDGIYCRKKGNTGYEWRIEFEDASQYEKVMALVHNLDEKDNVQFACHENFWWDFLEDQIDMEQFRDFLEDSAANGMPGYLMLAEDGTLVNPEAARFAKYTF